jgi:hypothetical protein
MATATQEKQAKAEPAQDGKKERARSWSYPAFSLQEAVAKARVLWEKENGNWIPVPVASEHWKFSAKSSSGIRAVAALAHYGLIEDMGSKESRKIRLSSRAKTILLAPPERAADKDKALREAALTPKAYDSLWRKHGGKLPSDSALTYDLQQDRGINPEVIKDFIKDFRATVAFAKLAESPTLGTEEGATDQDPEHEALGSERGQALQKPKGKGAPMPETQRAEGQAMDFPIPLLSGGFATLRLPVPLSKAEYTHFKSFLSAMLSGMEQAVTREPQGQSTSNEVPPQ